MAEVAGLVLGGIPIAVTGVKMILEGVSAGDRYLKYRLPLQTLHNQLLNEQTMYLNMCEELLNGIVDDDEKEILLRDPHGHAWKTSQLEASLKDRLLRSYPVFEVCVKSMQANIAGVNALLKVDDQGKININAESKFEKEYKRLKFSIKPSKYEKYVTRIRQDNLALMTMLGQNLRLEASRASKIKKVPDFSAVQKCASSVFSMLSSGFRCRCRASHGISLLLEIRSIPKHCEQLNLPTFHLAFSYSCSREPPEQVPPWELETAEVRMAEPENSIPKATIPPGPAKRGVRFNFHSHHHHHHPHHPHHTNNSSKNNTSHIPQSLYQNKLIADLCEELRRGQKWDQGACVGFLKCQNTSQRLDVFAPESPAFRSNAQTLNSLHQILRQPTSEGRPRFSRLKRLRVAVTLAFNLLQLHSTPWLKDAWGGEDIRFFDASNADPYEKAFISQRITSEGEVQAQRASFDGSIRNGPLFHLGILLIELCFNEPFERLREKVQGLNGGRATAVSDYFVAEKLLIDVCDEGGTTYGTAVTRCIRCNFDTPSLSLENESFREAVYKGVVSLLEEDLSHSLKLPA